MKANSIFPTVEMYPKNIAELGVPQGTYYKHVEYIELDQ